MGCACLNKAPYLPHCYIHAGAHHSSIVEALPVDYWLGGAPCTANAFDIERRGTDRKAEFSRRRGLEWQGGIRSPWPSVDDGIAYNLPAVVQQYSMDLPPTLDGANSTCIGGHDDVGAERAELSGDWFQIAGSDQTDASQVAAVQQSDCCR